MKFHHIEGIINEDQLDFEEYPITNAAEYQLRINQLLALASKEQIDTLVVYGDREHFANVEYLTGYDPRFEETLLILKMESIPNIVVGLEGKDYSRVCPLPLQRHLYSGFGLPGQPQTHSNLKSILANCGVAQGAKVGLIGWKSYADEGMLPAHSITDVPHYIVEAIAELVGKQNIKNKTDLMNDNAYGLRTTLSATEIVQAEMMNTIASRNVYHALANLKVGMSEVEASGLFRLNGLPLATHPSLSFGKENVSLGLASVLFHQYLKQGDIVSIGLGYRQAMIHRSAFFVKDEAEFVQTIGSTQLEFYKSYFEMITKWYESIRIGGTGGSVYDAIRQYLQPLGVQLNAGHQIHNDEWTNSLFFEGSNYAIASGMAIQCDVIASSAQPFASAHVEDGIVIANKELQQQIRQMAPGCFRRMCRRRDFMKNILSINIADEVLPLSDIQGMLFVFMANPSTILVND